MNYLLKTLLKLSEDVLEVVYLLRDVVKVIADRQIRCGNTSSPYSACGLLKKPVEMYMPYLCRHAHMFGAHPLDP